jgi:malate dehydrogenase (oxaloacetate-decarboxylating)
MKLAAAQALADLIPPATVSEDYVVPRIFDKLVVPQVAKAVAQAAWATGVARRQSTRQPSDDPGFGDVS